MYFINKNKFIGVLVFLFIGIFCFAQESTDKNGPKLTFDNEMHSYGNVHVNDVPEGNIFKTDISFTNTGNGPLILDTVKVCCNVTLIDWSKEPVMPGEKGMIKVNLKVHQRVPHRINRSVVVHSNCRDESVVRYRLRGMLVN